MHLLHAVGPYIHRDEFPGVVGRLAAALAPNGRLVFQARNMSAHWHPWPFPDEWAPQIRHALEPLFLLADRYEAQLHDLPQLFSDIEKWTRAFDVRVPAEGYWRRLEARWIPSLMDEATSPDALLHEGIKGMKERYTRAGRDVVAWIERYTLVAAGRR